MLGQLRRNLLQEQAVHARATSSGKRDLSTLDGWFRAYVAGTVPTAELERSLSALEAGGGLGAKRLRGLLPLHAPWIEARFDPDGSFDLLRLVVDEMRRGARAEVDLLVDPELRRDALRARRAHPLLVRLAPRTFRALLAPLYKTAEPVASRAGRPARTRAARPRRTRRSSGSSDGLSAGAWVLIVLGLSAALRGCTRFNRSPPPRSPTFEERMEEIERRRRELQPDAPEAESEEHRGRR